MKNIKLSVGNLVEFVLKQGDLQAGLTGASRAQEGIKAHQYIQKTSGIDYLPEITLNYVYQQADVSLEIKGRADGVIQRDAGFCIDEIKTTTRDLDLIDENYNVLHWPQAQCYAFMYARQTGLETAEVQLTYFQLDTALTKRFTRKFSINELSDFFFSLVERYLSWARRLQAWSETRDASIRLLQFPFGTYRTGQRELAGAVYQTIKHGQKLFAQAPTGIGKTIGTLFPSLKALAEGFTTQIFYLTAKTLTRTVAEKALTDLQNQGLAVKRLTLTAKDKLCAFPEAACSPEECPYVQGYYDRLRPAVEDLFAEKAWTRQVIEAYAAKHSLCPFEFSLEMANWADVVICDYNYVFDPRIYLKRFFLEGGEYTFLVDEAHNLVDRAREMFSSELNKESWLKLKRMTKDEDPKLAKCLHQVNSVLAKLKKSCTEEGSNGEIVQKELPTQLLQALRRFIKEAERFLSKNNPTVVWREQLLVQYFQALSFVKTADSYDEHYVTFLRSTWEDFRVKLFCLDPSILLKEALGRGRSAVLFSATLSPMEYFMHVLGGESGSYKLRLASPFPKEHLSLLINNSISTKYKQRQATYDQVAAAVEATIELKRGNYLVYFPSYDYLHEVYLRFKALNPQVNILCQTPSMTEAEREGFLAQFAADPERTLVGFALMGGIFGEGIDLIGNRLSGAVIVGVGLPQICTEREIIRAYYQTTNQLGFEFAYMYPGFNKVLQAVGRVIRTEQDRGVVLLIDERFALSIYKRLFPKEWQPVRYVANTEAISKTIREFWETGN